MRHNRSLIWGASNANAADENVEIFFFSGEESAITAEPVSDFKANAYYGNNKIFINIETPLAEDYIIEMYDLNGKRLVKEKIKLLYGKHSVSIPDNLAQGIYIVRLQNTSKPEQHLTQKIFIP